MTETEQVDPQPVDHHDEVVCALLGASGDESASKLGDHGGGPLSSKLTGNAARDVTRRGAG